MFTDRTVKLSLRLDLDVHAVIEQLARDNGIETNAYVQRLLAEHAMASGLMSPDKHMRVELSNEVIREAVRRAQELDRRGRFDEHFNLTVIRDLIQDDTFRTKYEALVGGDAFQSGLPGKSPINMYLGWYIKNAVGADPILDAEGKPRRVQVKNEAIQSYTLLTRAEQRP